MIKTGKLFEEIVEMLSNFRSEVQTASGLGLTNINKHAENFVKQILNVTYGYELENLNRSTSNYPGLDLGDTGASVAYQITATKKADKIEDTLQACLKHKHYDKFKTIKVFILTAKQSSYTIKAVTEPNFSFSSDQDIMDFDDLLRDIEHLGLTTIQSLHNYIKAELQPTIDAVNGNDREEKTGLLDTADALTKSKLPYFYSFHAKIRLIPQKIPVPTLYSAFSTFIQHPQLRNRYFSVLRDANRKPSSPNKIVYTDELQPTHATNHFYGFALNLEESSITVERAEYGDCDFAANLDWELTALLTCVLFFNRLNKYGFTLEITVKIESNHNIYLSGNNSMLIPGLASSYLLASPHEFTEHIYDVETPTLSQLLQSVANGFMLKPGDQFGRDLFIQIDPNQTAFSIDQMKNQLGVGNVFDIKR